MTVARTTHHFQHIIWTGLHFSLITVAEIPTIVKVLLGGYYIYLSITFSYWLAFVHVL